MRKICLLVALLGPGVSLCGVAQAQEGSNWQRVRQLPPHIKVHLSTDKHTRVCRIDKVEDDRLTCSRGGWTGHHDDVYSRAEVRKISIAHYVRSSFSGLAIGAGAGLIVGIATEHGPQCPSSGGFCLDIISNQDVWLIESVVGGVLGTAVGGPTDFTRGSVVYRRP